MDFCSKPVRELLKELNSSEEGLPPRLAASRVLNQRKYFKKHSRLEHEIKLFFKQFSNPLVFLLVIVVILSALLDQRSDTYIISIIIVITAVLGFLQEANAGRATEKLLSIISVKHRALRGGKECDLLTEEVVPGDILLFNAGDIIPADCRIIESNELHVNENSLTGESFPVEKFKGELPEDTPLIRKHNCLWRGTDIVTGTAKAVAVATGSDTLFGKITAHLESVQEKAFERGITRFGYFLLRITIILCVFILLSNLYFEKPFFNSLLFSLALAIGMAPELLPAIMIFTMTSGAKRMRDKKVIVKKLSSIFNYGAVDVLCTDKTGTITEGTVAVSDIVNCSGKADPVVKLYAVLNSTFQNGFTNSVDEVIKALPVSVADYEKTDEIPYDFIRKRLSIAVRSTKEPDKITLVTKGAVHSILGICNYYRNDEGLVLEMLPDYRSQLNETLSSYSNKGLRVLALSTKDVESSSVKREDENEMVFMGFILLYDPLKEDVQDSIARLANLNIKIKIITGDNSFAARYVADCLGLEMKNIITGEEMNKMSSEALLVKVHNTDVFAEVEPYQKERIVKALQKAGFTVAYLGDGINDVAAIHAADTGICTSNAVDVAKEAADFVLLEKDLEVLADGIYEGRKAFINSMKYLYATTGSTFGNMFSVAAASLILPFLPMLPKQILLSNLITDLPFLAIASDSVEEEEVRKPLRWNLRLMRRFMLVFGLHSSLFDFATFYVLYQVLKLRNGHFQTGWFVESVMTELLILFVIRNRKPIFKTKPAKILFWADIGALVVTICLPFSPFAPSLGLSISGLSEVLALLIIVITYFLTAELIKEWFFKKVEEQGRVPHFVTAAKIST